MSPSAPWRRRAELALVVLASLALVLTLVAAYARQTAVNSDQFANRATEALRDDSVNALLAQKITDEVILKREADLIGARPIIETVTAEVVGGRAFTGLFRAAVKDLHRALFKRDQSTVSMTVADVGTVLAAALQEIRPQLADQLRSTERVEVVRTDIGSLSAELVDITERVRLIALLLGLLSLALVAGALVISRDRRETAISLGIATAVAGVLLVVLYSLGRSIAVGHVEGPEEQAAARAVWDAFLGDLRTGAWILAGAGAVVAAAASSLIRPLPFGEPLRVAARRLAREPERPLPRALRGLAFIAAGVAILANRDAAVTLILSTAAVYLLYEGASALLRLVYRPEEHAETRAEIAAHRRRFALRRIAPVAIPAAVIVVAVSAFLGTGGVTTAAPAAGGCNGHEELCDRPLDQVALASTHNSMSVPLPGWFSALQEKPIAGQLADGVRGLLIDTHYADKLPNGRYRTVFDSSEDLRKRAKVDGVSQESFDAALRIRDRLGFQGEGERGMYQCHSFCELGATPLDSVLDDLRTFLVANPGAVVVVINQDYVTPEDFVAAVRDAELDDLAYAGPMDGPLPTLRELIASGRRIVFLAENRAGAAPWYRLAYKEATQETPYSFGRVPQLIGADSLATSCEPNRGPNDAPFFLLNHWITTDPLPRPSDALKVNAYHALLERARECERIRDHLPTLVAVNFYLEGDVFRAVDELNGIR